MPTAARPRDRRLRAFHVVAFGLAAVSPASSVFAILAPVAVAGGPAARPALAVAVCVGAMIAFVYAVAAAGVPDGTGEPDWVAHTLGAVPAAGIFTLTYSTIALAAALMLRALAELVGGGLFLVGGAALAIACTGVRRSMTVVLAFLALEVGALAVTTIVLLGGTPTAAAAPPAPGAGTTTATLAALPIILLALNGYGQTTYLRADYVGGPRRFGRIIYATLVVTVVVEGVPFLALAASPQIGAGRQGAFPLLQVLAAHGAGDRVLLTVQLGLGAALANALITLFQLGGRLRPPDRARARRTVSGPHDRPGRRTSLIGTAVAGTASICLAALPPALLVTATGAALIVIYTAVACVALTLARTVTSRLACVALLLLTVALLVQDAWAEPLQAASSAAFVAVGVGTAAATAPHRRCAAAPRPPETDRRTDPLTDLSHHSLMVHQEMVTAVHHEVGRPSIDASSRPVGAVRAPARERPPSANREHERAPPTEVGRYRCPFVDFSSAPPAWRAPSPSPRTWTGRTPRLRVAPTDASQPSTTNRCGPGSIAHRAGASAASRRSTCRGSATSSA